MPLALPHSSLIGFLNKHLKRECEGVVGVTVAKEEKMSSCGNHKLLVVEIICEKGFYNTGDTRMVLLKEVTKFVDLFGEGRDNINIDVKYIVR